MSAGYQPGAGRLCAKPQEAKAMTRKYTPKPAASVRGRRPFAIRFPLVPTQRIYFIPSFLFLITYEVRLADGPKVFPLSVRSLTWRRPMPIGGPRRVFDEFIPHGGGPLRDARGAVPRNRGARGLALPRS